MNHRIFHFPFPTVIREILNYSFLPITLFCLFFFICSSDSFGQTTKDKLQNQYKTLLNDIKKIEKDIVETKEKKKNSLIEVQSLQAKINARSDLIKNVETQINELEIEINQTNSIIKSLENDVEELKEEYAKVVYLSYKNRMLSNELYFIFSATSFNNALKRLRYIRKYTQFRKNQADLIYDTMNSLNKKKNDLQIAVVDKQTLKKIQEQNKSQLESESNQVNTLITQLNKDEKVLLAKVKKKNQDAQDLNNQIQKIIQEEIRIAQEKERQRQLALKEKQQQSQKPKGSEYLASTPAEKALSGSFTNNKTKLPWPVANGYIIERFGKHEHPSLKGVYINNNGIDIKTNANTDVRSVFEGSVVSVFYLPSNQHSVIIKHGEYFTVYSNLYDVNIKQGDKISTKQVIGKAYTQENESNAKVHLEIWKGIVKLDPQLWLSGN